MAVKGRKRKPPVILSQYGQTTEAARRQAAINMRNEPETKARVEALLIKQCGGDRARGLAKARHDYPEAYEDEVPS